MANWTETLALVRNKDGHATVRKATKDDNPAACFEVSQLDDLFATLQANKVNVSCDNFVMYGKETRDDGKPLAVKAAKQREYVDKEGEKRSANAAYSAAQIAAFVPASYACILKFGKTKSGKSFPLPLVMVYAVPREAQQASAPRELAFARATAQATEKPLERAKAK